MSDAGPSRSPPHAAGHYGPPPWDRSFQDQLALSRFAPGQTAGQGPMTAVIVPAWWRDERRQALQPLPVLGLDAYRGIEGGSHPPARRLSAAASSVISARRAKSRSIRAAFLSVRSVWATLWRWLPQLCQHFREYGFLAAWQTQSLIHHNRSVPFSLVLFTLTPTPPPRTRRRPAQHDPWRRAAADRRLFRRQFHFEIVIAGPDSSTVDTLIWNNWYRRLKAFLFH